MRGKNKSFLEDTFILLIIGILIYSIYSFFFSSNEENQINENITTVEKNIEKPTIKEQTSDEIKSDEAILEEEKKDEKLIIEEKIQNEDKVEVEKIQNEDKVEVEKNKETSLIEETKVVKKVESSDIAEKDNVELFFETIREKIYKNIEATPINNGEHINIRVTILKDGRYEQLTLMDGNKEYFELIKPSIYKVFPVKIDDSLKENFPRYFRMKIEAK